MTRAVLTASAVAAAVAGAFAVMPKSPEQVALAPLRTAEGAAIPAAATLAASQQLFLSDGSALTAQHNTALAVVENSARNFRTRLGHGKVEFDVTPTAGARKRRWIIEAGAVQVLVVGTRFSVDRTPSWVEVAVTRGTVMVSGPTVDGNRQRLTAGMRLRAEAEAPSASHGTAPAARDTSVPGTVVADPSLEGEAGEDISQEPTESEDPVFDSALLQQTDALRRQGKPAAAARLLRDALRNAPRNRESALWAFTLGQIELDALRNPRSAAWSFRLAHRSGLPPALREQSAARIVEAWAVAGEFDRAKRAARDYLNHHPRGANRNLVLRWLEYADQR